MPEAVLIAEDEETLRLNLVRYLEHQGYEVAGFPTGEEALAAAERRDFAVAVLDLRLPGMDGMTLAAELSARCPDTAILVMTAYGSVDSVIEALRVGAQDYLLKPVLLRDVAHKVALACEHRRALREVARLRRQLAARAAPPEIVARSRQMSEIVAFVRQVAPTHRTVLIEGESGSGKEVVARLLHDASPHREGPFVAVGVSTLPSGLIEACLFGHEKGAFAGADARREGLFRAAAGGTLFLDEVQEAPAATQAKLLRVIETKELIPVGAERSVRVDTRVVVASSVDLGELVRNNGFRSDLYFRLSALRIEVPPLRRHPDDIPALAELLLSRHAREHRRPVIGFDAQAMRRLLAYPWPGNVRELSNVVERAVLACAGKVVTLAELPPHVAGVHAEEEGGYHAALADFERALIRSTLEKVGGDRREAARVLGLSLATLYRRVEKLGLKDDADGEVRSSRPRGA